ncbi:MAG TPA: UvrD-helicase domain-containing protein [Bacteroidales bacterium]|nr:UvrD-helicase domain-containing protein [Bacteroidales bacterium]HOR82820.1 UvrD-helicase domain-containing protein [Bacteroidales bacterium]HPJ92112.1 UvrD-helicase domain-containing protein [Bacteroidales bacterium]
MHTTKNKSFLIYKASAGSGKTYNLAKAYLTICFSNFADDKYIYRKILGITFTNKAVYEMKTRILHFLKIVADGTDNELIHSFIDEDKDEKTIRTYAGEILKLIHHDYSNLSIFTIDTFFQQILRTFSYDLQLPSKHTVELEIDILTKKAVDMVLAKLGHDEALTNILIQFAFKRMDEDKNWRIENSLEEIAKVIFKESSVEALEKLKDIKIEDYQEIIKQLKTIVSLINNGAKAIAQRAVEAINNQGIGINDFFQGSRGIGQWFTKVASNGMASISPNSFVLKTITENQWTAKTADDGKKDAIEAIASVLIQCFNDLEAYKKKYYSKYQLSNAIYNNIYPIAIIIEIKNVIDQIKQEDSTLYISETNHIIHKIVQKEPAPFIYERLGNKYKYFFIDEFQDTSILQWQNLLPLLCDSLSSEVYQGKAGTSAVFGDAKQAIYRFREGDVRQFNRLPKIEGADKHPFLKEREDTLKANYGIITLGNNFRSKQEIVEFNNNYFTYIYEALPLDSYIRDAYIDLKQQWKENNTGGGVRLSMITNKERNYLEALADEVLNCIEEAINDNYQQSDIAILCRSRDVASFLTEKIIAATDYNVIASDSLLLNQSPIVRFLTACLYYISNSNNQVAAAVILQYIANEHNIKAESVFPYAKNKKDVLTFLKGKNYDFNLSKLKYCNTYECVEQLILTFRLQEKNDPFLMAFKGIVFDFTQTKDTNYTDFMEFWEERNASFSLSNPEGVEAVKIMTIHKSKGLQFPIVIYPQKRKRSTSTSSQWVDLEGEDYPLSFAYIPINSALVETEFEYLYREENKLKELDDINIDYVAFTRAEDRLYIVSSNEEDKWKLYDFVNHINIENESTNPDVERYVYGNFIQKTAVTPSEKDNNCLIYPIKEEVNLPHLVANKQFSSKETQWGELLHAYLSRILKIEDVADVRKRIKEDSGLLENEKNTLLQLSNHFLEEEYKNLFFGETKSLVKTEVELVAADGKIFRIDRLIINENNCTLIEFKTGSKEATHYQQVNTYTDLLKEIGYQSISSYLIYISRVGELSVEKL